MFPRIRAAFNFAGMTFRQMKANYGTLVSRSVPEPRKLSRQQLDSLGNWPDFEQEAAIIQKFDLR